VYPGKPLAGTILSFAMTRWAYQSPIKRSPFYHAHHCLSDVVYIADKGFYSAANVAILEARDLRYIIPVRRDNRQIDYSPLEDGEFKAKNGRFMWQGRIIWYYQYEAGGQTFITYLDDRLRVEEEQDYLLRITTHPDAYTEAGYRERLRRFGTLTLTNHLEGTHTPEEVYTAYKRRNEIEMMFDSYKHFMKGDVTYMRNRHVLEGWLFANFIAMMAYYKLYDKLRESKLLGKYSPKDIIEMSKTVYKLKIGGTWRLAEVTAKVSKLFAKAGIDYLNERS
jgi:transposase